MHVTVIGGGGREHALAWRLERSPSVHRLSAWPGNPGIAALGACVPGRVDDQAGILDWCRREAVDLVVVGPEAPLVDGLADRLRDAGCAVFGPSAAAAQIEGSKVFCKELLRDAGIPTAAFEVFADPAAADAYLRQVGAPIVVKADGLCAGKGAILCATLDEAHAAVDQVMRQRVFGAAGERVVIEAMMSGPELSVMALVDGEQVVPLPVAQDHKRALDGDRGLNTGGMGAYSPVPQVDPSVIQQIVEEFLKPTARALVAAGCPYQGVLYGGYMLTPDGISTLEYNCRFGDPEAQVILPRVEGDFGEILLACATGRLAEVQLTCSDRAAVCVVLAAGGYPAEYATGFPIDGLSDAALLEDVMVFQAGTRREGAATVTAGGRVLGVTALGQDLPATIQRAYQAVARIAWPGVQFRRDIASQAVSS
ncbi:MAG: phosphoribosylamine--glycine ligase [Fimbriimonadaceae bacterium]|nr:phosphoribosylamine--glycine ligase [Fimbriimonadaceae bacterium]